LKELDIFLKTAAEGLKSLTKALETVAEKMEELAKAQMEAKPPVEPAEAKVTPPAEEKKAPLEKAGTAADTVLNIIKRSRKGVDTAALKKKTGFSEKKIRNIIYKLKKQGQIKSERRGIYVKA
jgi:DNA replicative helicase MCM subunit Mcm2 (Cdc46/Mcm family)